MIITEAEIESAIITKLQQAFESAQASSPTSPAPTVPRFVGSWSVAPDGEVKGTGDASPIVIAVDVEFRAYDSFCEPQADLPGSIVLTVRRDACPTGAALAYTVAPILALAHRWNEDADAMCDDLTTASFSPGGFRFSGGKRVQSADVWIAPFAFTLRGVIHPPATSLPP
jgi:hypothetical protein